MPFMCCLVQPGRAQQLLVRQRSRPELVPRHSLCWPGLASPAVVVPRSTLPVSHNALRSSFLPGLGRRQVVQPARAVVGGATTAAAAATGPWSTLAVLCTCAAAAQVAEDHTVWGRLLSAPLLTLLLALGAAACGLLPPSSAVYDVVWSHLMPLAVALFLLDHDISSMREAGGPVLASFLLGAGTMLAGAAGAWLVCKSAMAAAAGSTAAAAKLAACLVASYIGGSVNFIAVAAATQLPTGLVPGAMAADNLGMLLLLGLLMAVPIRWLQQQGQPQLQFASADRPLPPSNNSSSSSSSGGWSGQSPRRQHQQRRSVLALAASAGARASGSEGSEPPRPPPHEAAAEPESGGPLGLDGSPLLTEPPSEFEVVAALDEISHGDNHTRMLPVLPPKASDEASSSDSSSSSEEEGWVALDGSPLWTQPPTPLEVATALDEISHGDNHTRVLPVNLSGKRSSSSSGGGGGGGGSGSPGDGMVALDGSPLLSEPPSELEVETALDEISHGDNHTRMLPVLPPKASSSRGGVSDPTASAASSPKCGGCPGSGVTAGDSNPLLTRVPSMGDGVSTIIAAKEGRQQVWTPPKPPSAGSFTSRPPSRSSNGSRGYNSQRGPDGLIVGCGGCSEALDATAAASPLPAAVAAGGWVGSTAAAGSSGEALALDGSPLLSEPPSELEVVTALDEISHGDNHTRMLPVLPPRMGSSSSSTDASGSTSNGDGADSSSSSGALALDGSLLLTEEPDSARLAAAVAAARAKGGSSVAVSPVVSGEFESLVRLDKDTLMQRLRHQQRKHKKQQEKQSAAAAGVTVTGDSSSSDSSSSSDDEEMLAVDGSLLLTQPPSGFEVAACLQKTASGKNTTRVLPVLPKLDSSSGSNGSSSSSSGALALDGSMLLTEEPDSARLAAAVAAARSKGGSNGSSVAVSALVSGEFESLVRLDKDTLMHRLRHQQRKHEKQQQKQQLGASEVEAAAAAVFGDSSSDSSSSSSDDDVNMVALDGSPLLTEPPSEFEVVAALDEISHGDNHTRMLPVLPPKASSSSDKGDSDDSGGSSGGRGGGGVAQGAAAGPATADTPQAGSGSNGSLTASTAAAAVAAAAVAAAVAHELASVFNTPALHQLFLAAVAVGISAAANAFTKTQQQGAAVGPGGLFAGSSQLGQVLIGVFFAALGASCCCPLSTLACCLPLLSFITVMTATHWGLLWGVGGRVMGLAPEALLCGSAAAIGGSATAAGLAAAKGWGQLVQPSLLCGSLGYALGTGAGLLAAQGLGVLA